MDTRYDFRGIRAAFANVYGVRTSPHAQTRHWATELRRESGSQSRITDLYAMADQLGLPICRTELSCDGLLRRRPGGKYEICLPLDAPSAASPEYFRERFTIAHEIGHFILDRNLCLPPPSARQSTHDALEEALCNVFAEHILISDDMIRADLKERGLRPIVLIQLAKEYAVSLPAFLTRIRYLYRHIRLMTVLWTRREGVIRATWASPSKRKMLSVPYHAFGTVERATITTREEEGFDTFYSEGRQTKYWCVSFAPSRGKIVTVATPKRHQDMLRPLAARQTVEAPLQLGLFGPNSVFISPAETDEYDERSDPLFASRRSRNTKLS